MNEWEREPQNVSQYGPKHLSGCRLGDLGIELLKTRLDGRQPEKKPRGPGKIRNCAHRHCTVIRASFADDLENTAPLRALCSGCLSLD